MKKAIVFICAFVAVVSICLCGCSSGASLKSEIVGTWVSADRSTADNSTFVDQMGNETVLEENSTKDYKIIFNDDGSYQESYSYENIKYDWNKNPPSRVVKRGENIFKGTYQVSGNTVTLTSENGQTTKLTYNDGVLESPQTANYTYTRQ